MIRRKSEVLGNAHWQWLSHPTCSKLPTGKLPAVPVAPVVHGAWCIVHSAWCNGASCPRMKAKPGPLPGHADHFLATALFSSIFERSTSRS